MNINGKNIILTGASSGIGLELLKILTTYQNVRIIAVARNIQPIPTIKDVVFPFSCDLSAQEGVDNLFEFAESTFGQADLFIANAGYAYLEKLNSADWQHISQIFALNTFSPIYSLQKLSAQPSAYFVCISSAVSTVPLPYYSLYCSTKAAIRQFMKAYQYEKPSAIHTMTVYPVATRTSFFEKANTNKQEPPLPFPSQSATSVAKNIIKGIEKNKKEVYPSFISRVFNYSGHIFPFIFKIYSTLEKRKIERSRVI